MASGSQNMTTYNARTVTGSNSAASPAGALLLSGEDRADDATGDTWIFLDSAGGTDTPWGIKHDQANNKIHIYGNNTDSVWTRMNTGDTYILGKVGIGYDPETSGNTYKLYVNGSSFFNDHIYLVADKEFYMQYDNTMYDVLHNHNNGNISVNAASAGLYIAYSNTTFVDWMNGRMQLKDGCLSIFPNNNNYREGIRIHSTGSWSDITLCGDDNTGDSGISANSWFIGNNNGNFYIARNGSPGSTAWLECVNNIWSTMNPLWIKGGSTEAGGDVNRLTTSAGMPGNMQYNTSRRGTQIYSNGIAFADPYNGNGNTDAGWIRHLETTGNTGYLEIGVGDDGNEEIIVRQYNTSNNVARQMYLLNSAGFTTVSNQSTDSSYAHAAMQIREANYAGASSDTWGVAPRLAWHWSGRVAAQIGLASNGWLHEAPSTGTNFYRIVCETGTWNISITGNAGSATYASSYLASRGSVSGSNHAEALKAYFNSYKASEPRNALVAHYSSASGNGSLCMGYFLSGYNSNPYGGFFVCHYNNPYYVGISNGTYTQQHILTSTNYTSYTVTKTGSGASGTWGINITGRSYIATYANYVSNAAHSVTLGTSGWGASNPWNAGNRTLIWGQSGKASASSDTADIVLYYGTHANAGGAGYFLHLDGGVWSMCGIYTAVWNDFAEYRVSDVREPGYVIAPASDGKNYLTTERMQPGARIISDTFGQSVGYCDEARTPLGVSGRVLAYPARAREEYKIGDCVCASPGGKIDIMTREEIMMYPDRIIGIVNEIPNYDVWERTVSEEGGGAKTHHLKTEVKGRIWIDIK